MAAPFLVIGAGVAGLAAARELSLAGHAVVVLEARDRIGGRIFTLHDPQTPLPVELGAEFVHGLHPALRGLIHEAGLTTTELDGAHLSQSEAGPAPMDSWEAMGAVFGAMANAPDQTFASFIDSLDAPDPAKRSATGYVEGFNAARKETVSVAWLQEDGAAAEAIEGDRSFHVDAGYGAIPHFLARGLDIRLSTPVRRIRWQPGAVRMETDTEVFDASRAIITAPFALLESGALPIDPEPECLTTARSALATGHAVRVIFRFRRAVWQRHPELSFLHGEGAFPVFWTPHPHPAPIITGWAAGPKADALAGKGEAEVIRAALDSLRGLLGEDPGEPEATFLHDWRTDPWSAGAYTYGRVHGAAARYAFAEPVDGTLCFAGEAVCPAGHMGTVHGAMRSGIDAARKLIAYKG